MLSKTNQLEILAMNDLKKIINNEDPAFFTNLMEELVEEDNKSKQ